LRAYLTKCFARGPWSEAHLGEWVTLILLMVNVGLGTTILVGGVERFPIPTYDPLIDYAYGRIWIWGVIILCAAFLIGTPFRWFNIMGLWLSMAWHFVWMAAFTISVAHFPASAATPIPVYGGFAMISAALMTAKILDRPREG
jgi:ABC-type microcin C transport system permease subunit YejB